MYTSGGGGKGDNGRGGGMEVCGKSVIMAIKTIDNS